MLKTNIPKQLSMMVITDLIDNHNAKMINIYGASGYLIKHDNVKYIIWDGEHIGTTIKNKKPLYFNKDIKHKNFRKYLKPFFD